MLRIIVLHEPVAGGKQFFQEREKRLVKDVAKQVTVHDAIENAYAGAATFLFLQ